MNATDTPATTSPSKLPRTRGAAAGVEAAQASTAEAANGASITVGSTSTCGGGSSSTDSSPKSATNSAGGFAPLFSIAMRST